MPTSYRTPAILLGTGCDMQDVRTISRYELKNLVEEKRPFTLVETLSPQHFAEGHLPGAVNLPPEQVRTLAPTLLPEKNAEIVVYCASPT